MTDYRERLEQLRSHVEGAALTYVKAQRYVMIGMDVVEHLISTVGAAVDEAIAQLPSDLSRQDKIDFIKKEMHDTMGHAGDWDQQHFLDELTDEYINDVYESMGRVLRMMNKEQGDKE